MLTYPGAVAGEPAIPGAKQVDSGNHLRSEMESVRVGSVILPIEVAARRKPLVSVFKNGGDQHGPGAAHPGHLVQYVGDEIVHLRAVPKNGLQADILVAGGDGGISDIGHLQNRF